MDEWNSRWNFRSSFIDASCFQASRRDDVGLTAELFIESRSRSSAQQAGRQAGRRAGGLGGVMFGDATAGTFAYAEWNNADQTDDMADSGLLHATQRPTVEKNSAL